MKKRLVCGDIHGHFDTFLEIYNEENPDDIILLGDYVDSFTKSPKECYDCLTNILFLKENHKKGEFIMLLGNHDFHYLPISERYSGYKIETKELCSHILFDNIYNDKTIKIIYIDKLNNTIYSHAGISNTWFKYNNIKSLEDINKINKFSDLYKFKFSGFNFYGDDATQGPLWIRPNSLQKDMFSLNNFTWNQIVGHTHTKKPLVFDNLTVIDTMPNYYIVQELDNGIIVNQEIKERNAIH